jgi:hypothetical protein
MLTIYLLTIQLNIVLPSPSRSSMWTVSKGFFPTKIPYASPVSPITVALYCLLTWSYISSKCESTNSCETCRPYFTCKLHVHIHGLIWFFSRRLRQQRSKYLARNRPHVFLHYGGFEFCRFDLTYIVHTVLRKVTLYDHKYHLETFMAMRCGNSHISCFEWGTCSRTCLTVRLLLLYV